MLVLAVACASPVAGRPRLLAVTRKSRWAAIILLITNPSRYGHRKRSCSYQGRYCGNAGHGQHRHVRGQAEPERKAACGLSTGSGAAAGTIRRTAHYGAAPGTQTGQLRKAISSAPRPTATPVSVALVIDCLRAWSADGH